MKYLFFIDGPTHSGKTIILKVLNKIGYPSSPQRAMDSLETCYQLLKNFKIDKKEDRIDCLSVFKPYDDKFFYKLLSYTPYEIIATKFKLNKYPDDIPYIRIFITRDPRVCWLLNNDCTEIENFMKWIYIPYLDYFKYKDDITMIRYDDLIKDCKKEFSIILRDHKDIDLSKIELPSKSYNSMLTMVDYPVALKRIKTYTKKYTDDFKIIEKVCAEEIETLGYPKVLSVDDVLKEQS